MKYAIFNGKKTHASQVVSGNIGHDLWFPEYEVMACVGKYRQYWKYTGDKPQLPNGYEKETDWHAAWKCAIVDDACEVVCGENREHRADIKTEEFVLEIQKSPIDGWAVVERNSFYNTLTNARLIWIVNVEIPWREKRISTKLVKNAKDGRFVIEWKYKWKWVQEISGTVHTHLFLDFNTQSNKMIKMWTHRDILYGKWLLKKDFFDEYLSSVMKENFKNGEVDVLSVFKDLL